MRTTSDHIIKKTTVNFVYNGNTDGLKLQKEVDDWCSKFIRNSLNSIFAEYDQMEDVIAIDLISLDIDLGKTENWKTSLENKIRLLLKETISEKIALGESTVKVKTETKDFSEILLFYLKHGFLPWFSKIKTAQDFEYKLRGWLDKITESEIKELLLNLHDDKAVERLALMLKENEFEIFIAKATGKPKQKISSLFESLQEILTYIPVEKILQERLLNDFKEMLISALAKSQALELSESTAIAWIYTLKQKYLVHLSQIDPEKLRHEEAKKIILRFQKDKPQKTKANLAKIRDRKENIVSSEITKKAKPASEPGKELAEGAYLNNAGLVIIAPFFTSLFSRTGLLKEDKINNLSMALKLIHYCITGKNVPAEFELVLPKILCGIDPETVIEFTSAPDENLMREADDMLLSVIEYWTVLKDTSVRGLQEAFLQRDGKLLVKNEEWQLYVEQKPFDMLLEQLPWNISMIKLPWMKKILRTHWI